MPWFHQSLALTKAQQLTLTPPTQAQQSFTVPNTCSTPTQRLPIALKQPFDTNSATSQYLLVKHQQHSPAIEIEEMKSGPSYWPDCFMLTPFCSVPTQLPFHTPHTPQKPHHICILKCEWYINPEPFRPFPDKHPPLS